MSLDISYDDSSCDPEPGAPCSFPVYVNVVEMPGTGITLEGRKYHPIDQTYSTVTASTTYGASVSPAIEGSDVLLTVDGAFEYYVEDRSADTVTDYTDSNNTQVAIGRSDLASSLFPRLTATDIRARARSRSLSA